MSEKVPELTESSYAQRVIIVVHFGRFFGRSKFGWQSIDVDVLRSVLAERYEVEVLEIDELSSFSLTNRDVVVYGSSDDPGIRQYYKDVLYLVKSRARIVPDYNVLMAHENKGFQDLLAKELGISIDGSVYIYDPRKAPRHYPFVLKAPDGAGSSKVELIRDGAAFKRAVRKLVQTSLWRRALLAVRKFHLSPELFRMYKARHQGYSSVVCQSFIPGLSRDYKVLVFGDNYYVLDRLVRPNDFRASGSGRFEFRTEPNVDVLDFSRRVYSLLDVPYISMDVAKDEHGNCYLIEFQGVHFGPYAVLESPGAFRCADENWDFFPGIANLEAELGQALALHIYNHAATI